ncbi:hypothetical protein ACSBR2_023755 [Camellia fascicularis]
MKKDYGLEINYALKKQGVRCSVHIPFHSISYGGIVILLWKTIRAITLTLTMMTKITCLYDILYHSKHVSMVSIIAALYYSWTVPS